MAEKADAKIAHARGILAAYWGTSGPDKALRREDLRKLKLTASQLEDLMDELPPPGGRGDTGQRVAECYRFLERLAG